MTDLERGKNLIVVAAIDRYADEHGLTNKEVHAVFQNYNLLNIIRENYDTLHTQGLFEGAAFAEDYIMGHTL
jgi:hypothetical protein